SSNWVTASALQPVEGGRSDAFVAKLSANGQSEIYSTFLGGSADEQAYRIAVDNQGQAYVTGWTNSSSTFPIVSAFQPSYGGATDAFVAELNAAGNALVFSSFLGGNSPDAGQGIALAPSGDIYIAGFTRSSNFPLVNPFQTAFQGGQNG